MANNHHSQGGSPVLRYIPKSMRNKGQSPFEKVEALKDLTIPLTKIDTIKIEKPVLKGFVQPKNGPKVEHGTLPSKRTEEGFDPNAYKLLAKAGYNPQSQNSLGKLIPKISESKIHGLNETQRMLKENGHSVKGSRAGLGYEPPSPVRLVIKRANNCYTSVEDENSVLDPKPTFD